MKASVLYITYDGLMEPLGQSQVWQYLRSLSKLHSVVILSFEKPEDLNNVLLKQRITLELGEAGIQWFPLRYHKSPSALATLYDLFQGTCVAIYAVFKYKIKIVHARSYVASVIALALKKIAKIKFIFDMRGFWPDERVDGGIWPDNSKIYKVAKWFERKFLLNADVIVSLTHAGIAEIKKFPYLQGVNKKFEVIPTCANLDLFQPYSNSANDNFVLGYVGSVGTWYLFDEVLRTFKSLCKVKNDSRLLIINRGEHSFIRERISSMNIDEYRVEIKSVEHKHVPTEISRMDAGIFYIKPVFSKKASAPTKFGEFLGCGIPCIGNAGVGDTESILDGMGVGVALRGFSEEEHDAGVITLLKLLDDSSVSQRCVKVAQEIFSLEKGVESYNQIYQQLNKAS